MTGDQLREESGDRRDPFHIADKDKEADECQEQKVVDPDKQRAVLYENSSQDDEKHEVNCYITWNGITIPVRYDLSKADLPGGRNYVNESLSSGKICYCEIKRIWFRSGYKYYVDIYMKGDAPKKVEPGKSVMGIDEGTSTVAAVSGDAVFLEELAPRCVDYNKEIAKLQRQIDVSTRKTNPDKFKEDGTCRKRSEWKEKLSQEKGEAAGTVPQKIGICQMPA